MKSAVITFSGIDGAGKSTQVEKLSNHLAQAGIPVHKMTLWDDVALFRTARAGFSRTVLQSDSSAGSEEHPVERKDKNAQAGALLVGRSILYLLDLISLRRTVRKARSEKRGVIIFDRYIYDQLAALPMKHWLVRAYARVVLRLTPKPDLSYLLDAVPEVARARKPEYPIDFLHQYRNSYLELRKLAGLRLIPAGEPDAVYHAILRHFTKLVQPLPSEAQSDSVAVA